MSQEKRSTPITMSGDQLTRLPDAMLWQVLSHVPAKEAVSTGALSRSWRSLWLSSGVLNLDSRSYGAGPMRYSPSLVFIRDANAALDAFAAGGQNSLRKLTFTYFAPDNDENMYWSRCRIDDGLNAQLTGAVVTRGLEEFHIRVSPPTFYSLSLAALPCDALRMLHLHGLSLTAPQPCLPPAPAWSFARLETLWLRRCTVRLTELQAIVDVAPLLAALELDHVYILYEVGWSSPCTSHRRLRCPQVTALSLTDLGGWWWGMELDAPSVRHFAYKRSGGREALNVSLEQPGARRRVEQIKELNLRVMNDALFLRL